MKWNNKILAATFFVLLAIWILNTFVSGPKTRSFRATLVQIDTAAVNRVVLYPKGLDSAYIALQENKNGWTASNGKLEVQAEPGKVQSLLAQLVNIPTKQLISKSPDKRKDYEVDEATGKWVEIYNNGQLLEKVIIGRFSFNPNTRQATSYARLEGEDDIYSIDGFMSMSFDTDFNNFRNKSLLSVSAPDIKSLTYTSGQNTVNIGLNGNGEWMANNKFKIDSAEMTNYLDAISSLSGSEFVDDFSPDRAPDKKLEIVADNITGPKEVVAYIDGGGFVLRSSSNPAFFASGDDGIYKKVFLDLEALLARE